MDTILTKYLKQSFFLDSYPQVQREDKAAVMTAEGKKDELTEISLVYSYSCRSSSPILAIIAYKKDSIIIKYLMF